MGSLCTSRLARAARRLVRALREAAGTPKIDVIVDYRDGHAAISEIGFGAGKWLRPGGLRAEGDPPTADVKVLLLDGPEVAHAEWDGRGNISGDIDPDGAMSLASGDLNVEWDEWIEFQGRTRPSHGGQLPLVSLALGEHWGEMLRVRDANGADFATAIEAWIRNLSPQLAEFEDIDLDDYVRCERCEELIEQSAAFEAWGDYYCDEHAPSICEKCQEPIPHDEENYSEDGYTYCNDCYTDTEEVWENFYEDHPRLRDMEALEKADMEEEMPPEVYVTIFNDLDWNSAYGGSAWAHIAETWRDLAAAVEEEDWPRMHLLIDHAFDLVHNTGSLFTKAKDDVKKWLFRALEDKYFLDPLQYRGKLSADARKLLDLHIRYSGGVAKWKEQLDDRGRAAAKFEKSLGERELKMAERLWNVHDLNLDLFRGRESFLEVAFWLSDAKGGMRHHRGDFIEDAKVVRAFLKSPSRTTAMEVMDNLYPDDCKAGTAHPAGSVLRGELVPHLLKVVSGDAGLRKEMAKDKEDEDTKRLLGRSRPWRWDRWVEFLKAEKSRQKEFATVAFAISAAFARIALSSADFYDFYALTVVDCDRFDDDTARMCAGLKKVTTLGVAKSLLDILARAVMREARHISDQLAPY